MVRRGASGPKAPRRPGVLPVIVSAPEAVTRAQDSIDLTLLEQEEQEERAVTTPRGSKTRSFDQTVNKAIEDNFIKKGFAWSQVQLSIKGGRSILELVTDALKKKEDGIASIGALFYQNLRQILKQNVHGTASIKVEDPTEPKDDVIEHAVQELTEAKMNRGPFDHCFETLYMPLNQRAAASMFRAFLDVPCSTPCGSEFLVAAVKYIWETRMHCGYPALLEAAKKHFDRAFEKNFLLMRKDGLSEGFWVECHEDYLGLIADVDAIKECVGNRTTWSDKQADLMKACKSECGNRIFGDKLRSLAGAACDAIINKDVENFKKGECTKETTKSKATEIKIQIKIKINIKKT